MKGLSDQQRNNFFKKFMFKERIRTEYFISFIKLQKYFLKGSQNELVSKSGHKKDLILNFFKNGCEQDRHECGIITKSRKVNGFGLVDIQEVHTDKDAICYFENICNFLDGKEI